MFLRPKSREEWLKLRHAYVSSTQSAALFGASPYLTAFELAVSYKEAVSLDDDIGERGTWGLRLQEAIARGFAEDFGIKIRAMSAYAVLEDAKMGASFDYEIVGPDGPEADGTLVKMYVDHGAGVFEIKNVDSLIYRNTWHDGQPPAHIELQVQHQLHCAEREWAAIGVLVGGNKSEVLIRNRDAAVGELIEAKVRAFWENFHKGVMPPVDLPEDAEVIRKLYGYAEPESVLDAQGDEEIRALCEEYQSAQAAQSAAEAAKKTAGAKLIMKIGTAEKVLAKGYSISAGMVAASRVEAYDRAAYRNFRVYTKKEAKK